MKNAFSPFKSVELILKGLIILLLAFQVWTFASYSYRLLLHPYDWEPSESDHVIYATRLLEGESLYKDDDSFPLLCMNYPPGYHLLLTVPVKLFGPTMFGARIFTVLISLSLGLLIYRIIVKETGWRFLGITMAISLFAYGPISAWLPIIRMDSTYIVLSITALYLISRHGEGRKFIFFASLFLAYSFFTKQQGIFALGAGILFLLTTKKYRECAALVLLFAIFTIPLNIGYDFFTDGWYNRHLFGAHLQREFSWGRKWFLIPFVSASSLLLALTCFELVWEFRNRRLSVWTCYLLGTLPIALLIFYNGTAENHFLPLFSALLITAAAGLEKLKSSLCFHKPENVRSWLYLLIILQLATFSCSGFFLTGPSAEDSMQLDSLKRQIHNSTEPVLVDRMNSLIIGTEHETYFMQPVLLRFLYDGGKWNPDVVISALNERIFSMVCVFDKSQFVPPVLEAIDKNYRPVKTLPVKTFRPGFDCSLIVLTRKPG